MGQTFTKLFHAGLLAWCAAAIPVSAATGFAPDPTFGTAGVMRVPSAPDMTGPHYLVDVQADGDGALLIARRVLLQPIPAPSATSSIRVPSSQVDLVRVSHRGVFDTAYGNRGRTVLEDGYFRAAASRISVRPDGSAAFLSHICMGSAGLICDAKAGTVAANGTILQLATSTLPFSANGGHWPGSVAAAADGGFHVGGAQRVGTGLPAGNANLVRFRADGTVEERFGTWGTVSRPLRSSQPCNEQVCGANQIAVQLDGSIFFSAVVGGGLMIYKMDTWGLRDDSFGEKGQVLLPIPIDESRSTLSQVIVLALPDDSVVIATLSRLRWTAANPDSYVYEGTLTRLDARGRLQQAYPLEGNGIAEIRLLPLRDSSVLVVGTGGPQVSMFRMTPSGALTSRLGNIDLNETRITGSATVFFDRADRLVTVEPDTADPREWVVRRFLPATEPVPQPVTEFFNTALRHYFITAGPGEVQSIETGGAGPGWTRTFRDFKAYLPETGIPGGAMPVCRYYGTPGAGPNSHFYSIDSAECAEVSRDPGWTYEGIAFYLFPPTLSGTCRAGTRPVYRVYNRRFAQNDSNHRYTTDPVLYAHMINEGWAAEGVKLCAPS